MTARRDSDRVIATWLTEVAPESHVDYLDETLVALDGVRQRPVWASPGRWLPMQLTLPRVVVPRAIPYLALLALLLIGLVIAVAIAGGQKRLPAPFGIAATGLIAFESEGSLFVVGPDGQARRPLISGAGELWGQAWSHRGDRIAYWSSVRPNAPASVWIAQADGTDPRIVTGTMTFDPAVVTQGHPSITWSPDDRRLAFTAEGVLYVVKDDGTGLTSIGGNGRQREEPTWSPDGSLIAYRGNLPNTEATGGYVIRPDGTGDMEISAPTIDDGLSLGWFYSHFGPNWSPDSNAVIFQAGATDITVSRRDVSGIWSEAVLIGGLSRDFMPSWSNSGTRFSFLRLVSEPDADPLEFELMVANADGSDPHRLSPSLIEGLGYQCWSPDDRFIRAASYGDAPNDGPKGVLVPLDGSAVVEIPGGGPNEGAACAMQRLAP